MKIYVIINKINGKKYYGITKDTQERFNYHKTRAFQKKHKEYDKVLYRAFRKYGLENFDFIVIEGTYTIEEAKEKEKELILKNKTLSHENGYNVSPGGEMDGAIGENVNTAKLTTEEVIQIRKRRNRNEKQSDVYEDYKHKVKASNFQKVWLGQYWSHIALEDDHNWRKLPSGSRYDLDTILEIRFLNEYTTMSKTEIQVYMNIPHTTSWNIRTYKNYKDIILLPEDIERFKEKHKNILLKV